MYNRYHAVFLNAQLQTFQIIENKILPFCFQYDLWYDVDKPQHVGCIIDALMGCDLFPSEIYNIVSTVSPNIVCKKLNIKT